MNKTNLRRLSISLSVIAWLIFTTCCLVPMNEGGLAAFSCLIMIAVFTAIIGLDIFGTLFLDRPKLGCLTALYFITWLIVLVYSALLMLTAPFMLQGEGAKTPWWGKLCFSLVFTIPTGFALVKILIGVALRRGKNETEKIQTGTEGDAEDRAP